jgi:RTX calcium-binding nonapeptide repeat (4 copies)
MPMTAAEARAALAAGDFSLDALFVLVEQVDGNVDGPTNGKPYLLYSGEFQDGRRAVEVAASIQAQGEGVTVGRSHIGQVLNSNEFAIALDEAVKLDLFGDPDFIPSQQDHFDAIITKKNLILNGKDGPSTFDPRVPNANSMWDIASKKFVQEAVGDFRIITPDKLDDLSVFVQSELPALLDNGNIESIDGYSRAELKVLSDTQGIDAIKQLMVTNSISQLLSTGLFSGTSTSTITSYLQITPDKINSDGLSESQIKAWQDGLGSSSDDLKVYLKQGKELALDLSKSAGAGLLKSLGPVSIVLGFMIATSEAEALEAQGRHEEAKAVMNLWAVEAAGSEAAGIAAGAIAGIGTAALVAAGIITGPVALVIVVGAALAGGYFGGEQAKAFYLSLNEMSDEQKQDVINRLQKLFFGPDASASIALTDDTDGGQFDLESIQYISETLVEMVVNAKESIAWRYALRELNPFVVTDADYDQHNLDESLDLYDPITGNGAMSDSWLQARASFLLFDNLYRKSGDTDGTYEPLAGFPYPSFGDIRFVDYFNGGAYELFVDGIDLGVIPTKEFIFGGNEGEGIYTGAGDDRLFGAGGNDVLSAGSGEDTIEGGEGADRIIGGQDNDLLAGGSGNDIFSFTTGDGLDHIVEEFRDAGDRIHINGVDISDLTRTSPSDGFSFFEDSDKNTYTYDADAQKLTIFIRGDSANGVIYVDHFEDGDFGLNFLQAGTDPYPDTNAPTVITVSETYAWGYDSPLDFPTKQTASYVSRHGNLLRRSYFRVNEPGFDSTPPPSTTPQYGATGVIAPGQTPYYGTTPEDVALMTSYSYIYKAEDVVWDRTEHFDAKGYTAQYVGYDEGHFNILGDKRSLYVFFEGDDYTDILTGGALSDNLVGHAGIDIIELGDGNDVANGGLGRNKGVRSCISHSGQYAGP